MSKKILLLSFVLYAGLLVPHAGQVNAQAPRKFYNLGIFVAFPGYTTFTRNTDTHYTTLSRFISTINDPRSGSYSVKSMMRDFSYGRLDYEFKTFPNNTVADTIVYYLDDHPAEYYYKYSASNPIGYSYDENGVTYLNPDPLYSSYLSTRSHDFYVKAIAFANQFVPEGELLDGDGDGYVDNVSFIWLDDTKNLSGFASGGGYPGSIAGTNLNNGSRLGGDNWKSQFCYGIFMHEVGHTMGMPDRYQNQSPYRNDIGDGTKEVPFINFPRYYLNTYRRDVKPNEIVMIAKSGTYAINPEHSATPDSCYYRINSPFSSTEFFYLSYVGKSLYEVEQEGLQISRITPGVRGNAQWGVYKPVEQYFLRPFGNPEASNFLDRDITEFSDPALILSDKTTAGFRIKNIRKDGTQLKFDFEYTDTKPFIDVLDTVDVMNSGVTTIEWPVTVNPANARAWKIQAQNAGWLNYAVDYDKQVIRMTSASNTTAFQRNATFRVYVDGTTLVDWAYMVQRPANNAKVKWAPQIVSGVLTIDGSEGMRNFRLIGDDVYSNTPLTLTTGDAIKIKLFNEGKIKYLPTRELSFYAYTNNTGANRDVSASYKNYAGTATNFTIRQTSTIEPEKTYWIKPMPVANDGKWYTLESKKASKVFGNYLQPVKAGLVDVLGVGVFTPSDSVYWTFETNTAGRVVIRNKALGYLDFDALASNVFKFKQTIPTAGVTMWQGEALSDNTPGISFYSDTTSTFKGLRYTDLANDYRIGYNNFGLKDEETRFIFTERSVENVFSLASQTRLGVNVGDSIGCTTDEKAKAFNDAINLAYRNYTSISNPIEEQTNAAFKAIWAPRATFLNSIKKVQTSTAAAPVWYRIKTNLTYWSIWSQFYFYTTGTTLQNTLNLTSADNFLFRFELLANGKVRIIPKSYPTKALRAGNAGAGYTFSIAPFDQYTEFDLVDYPGWRGVKKMIVGKILNASYPSYLNYDRKAVTINNYLEQSLLRGQRVGEYKDNTFDFEAVDRSLPAATESVIAEDSIIRIVDGQVLVDGTDKVDIYNIYGVKMPLKQRLVTGVYIVVVGNHAQKILVR